ncbi:phage holin family protein [uncultured Corynebacterium sp.]|uniref:phage holin family protein n=1 Tax=uncultured Corynebacterium sp. TaxID=159447 RepID=UPI00260F0874|nr:phage holin family protein [uncultured Corynebacterium sp.]
MSNDDTKGLFTDGTEPRVTAIPLSDVDSNASGDASIGQLVSNASTQISALVRSEIELAKAEIAGEAKKGAVGGGFFAVAGVVALYSSFFFFFFLGWLLDVWLPTWAAFLIVFVLMLVIAGVAALLGLKKVKSIRKPEKTIESVQELKSVVPSEAAKKSSQSNGMYT